MVSGPGTHTYEAESTGLKAARHESSAVVVVSTLVGHEFVGGHMNELHMIRYRTTPGAVFRPVRASEQVAVPGPAGCERAG